MTKVLLVEDDADNARMIARLLRMRGYEVVAAGDGAAAVEAAGRERPDVVLMDLLLEGGMSGLDCTRHIRAAASAAEIPIIILSASHLASFQNEAFQAGADDVDTKPIELDRLIGKIEALLSRK